MRFDSLLCLVVAYAAVGAQATASPDGGSLDALLDRIANEHKEEAEPLSNARALASAVSDGLPATTTKMIRRSRNQAAAEQAKRWVWATGVIQDGATDAPPIGQNVNQLGATPTTVTTPAVVLPSPSYLPAAAVAQYLNASNVSVNASTAANSSTNSAHTATPAPRRPLAAAKMFGQPKADHRRWIWATSVIQDGATGVPPPGTNANLLSNGAPATTPEATLVSPTFPPAAETSAATTSTEPSSAPVAANAAATSAAGLARAAETPEEATPTTTPSTSVAVPVSTSPAMHWWNPADLFKQIEAGFEELLHGSSSPTAEPVAESEAPNEKRWIWANSVIQDGATGVPPPGQNANLLTDPTMPAETPTVSLNSPTFAPAPSSMTPPAAIKAAVYSASSSVATTTSAASATTSTLAAQRMTYAQRAAVAHAAALAAEEVKASSQSVSNAASPPRLTYAQRVAAARAQHEAVVNAAFAQAAPQSAATTPRQLLVEHENALLASASSAIAAAKQTAAGQVYRHKKRMERARRH